MQLPVSVRRRAYRVAYCILRVYWFAARPAGTGVKCVLTKDDCVLLVRHTYGDTAWALPGGRIRRHEPPPDAARREIREELGVDLEDWTSLGEFELRIDHRRDKVHCFRAELGGRAVTLNRAEIAATRWFPRDELPRELSASVRSILAWTSARQ